MPIDNAQTRINEISHVLGVGERARRNDQVFLRIEPGSARVVGSGSAFSKWGTPREIHQLEVDRESPTSAGWPRVFKYVAGNKPTQVFVQSTPP